MDIQFETILSVCLIPYVIDLIASKENMDEISAIDAFYHSITYEKLAIEETKVWHFSPLMLYTMWKYEKETGEFLDPET